MANRETKTVALTVAASLVAWGVQQATTSDVVTGAIGVGIGLLIMFSYQYVEDADHKRVYDDVIGAMGEDTFKTIAETSSDKLKEELDTGESE